MWTLILITVLSLFRNSSENVAGNRTISSATDSTGAIPKIWSTQILDRPFHQEQTLTRTDSDMQDDELITKEFQILFAGGVSPTMLAEGQDSPVNHEQDTGTQVIETKHKASFDNMDLSEYISNSKIPEHSSNYKEMNENIDSEITTENSSIHFSKNVTGSSLTTEEEILENINGFRSVSDEKPITKSSNITLENSTDVLSDISIATESSDTIPVVPIHDISSDQHLTEEISSSFPTSSSTTENNVLSLESLSYGEKGRDLSQPNVTEVESPGIYSEGKFQIVTEDPFQDISQDYNTYQTFNFNGSTPLGKQPSLSVSSTNRKLTTTSLFIFDEFPLYTHTKNGVKTTSYPHHDDDDDDDVKGKSVSVESTKTSATNELTNVNTVSKEAVTPPLKQLKNETYKIILKKNCSGDIVLSHIFQLVNSIFNSQLNTNNSTKLMKCKYVYELNFTSNIASPESFSEVITLIKKALSPDIDVNIWNSGSTVHQISHTTADYSDSFIVPKSMVYIVSATTLGILMFMIFIVLCVRNKCKRSSTSLDLSDIPHLSLSVDDYKLAPIPRPSVSFPESNRDFLHAYANETYCRTREDDIALSQHPFGSNIGKVYDVVGQKDKVLAQEMQTFNTGRSASRNGPHHKLVPGSEYASTDSWDRLKGREKGVDNPAFRRW